MIKTAKLGEYTLTFSNAAMFYADSELRKMGAPSVMKSGALLFSSILSVLAPLTKDGGELSLASLDSVELDAPEVQAALDKVDFVVINIILWGFMRPTENITFDEALNGPLSELSPIDSIKVLMGLFRDNVATTDDSDGEEKAEKKT